MEVDTTNCKLAEARLVESTETSQGYDMSRIVFSEVASIGIHNNQHVHKQARKAEEC